MGWEGVRHVRWDDKSNVYLMACDSGLHGFDSVGVLHGCAHLFGISWGSAGGYMVGYLMDWQGVVLLFFLQWSTLPPMPATLSYSVGFSQWTGYYPFVVGASPGFSQPAILVRTSPLRHSTL